MAENRIDVEKLKDDNPWKKLIEKVEKNGYDPNGKYYAIGKDELDLLDSISNEKCHIYLEILPSHYTGNILDAKAVIFALNPGYVEKEKKNDFYRNSVINEIRIQHLKFEYKYFFPVDPEGMEKWKSKSPYWYEKLSHLWGDKKDEDIAEKLFKKVAQNVALLQLFPYHSEKWCGRFSILKKLETVKYTRDLAKYCIQEGKIIIIARGKKYWLKLVEELNGYEHLYTLLNPANPYVSEENVAKCEFYKFEEVKERILSE